MHSDLLVVKDFQFIDPASGEFIGPHAVAAFGGTVPWVVTGITGMRLH